MSQLFLLFSLVFAGSVLASSVRIINGKNQAIVERMGSFNRKLDPGISLIIPGLDRIVHRDTTRGKVMDIPHQSCMTKDNIAITVDTIVYWQIFDLVKAYYEMENLQMAILNLVMTQLRAEIAKLELDEALNVRGDINEILLPQLYSSLDLWGVRIIRVELRKLVPAKAVQDSIAERKN
jgi:regulator of protease activity HflC (stomatin/prohibitin superfamily)